MTASGKFRVAIIGAGASGLMALIKMREAGFEDVTVFEKAPELGGTWYYNRYPGLTCDVPSLAYRYSFAPNPDWSHVCSPGPEIHAYLKRVAAEHQVEQFIKCSNEVTKADFIDGRWHIETVEGAQGAFDAVLAAAGVLHHPVYPDIPGLKDFSGPAMHTSEWDQNVTLDGKRVGIIGTGSTATQIVAAITSRVAQLSLFQRTAQWMLALPNPPISDEQKALFRDDPALLDAEYQRLSDDQNYKFAAAVVGENPSAYAALENACKANLEASVADPDLRARLTPNYPVGCKRLIMSDGFYAAIQRPNAELVTDGIERIETTGVRTTDGRLHELDVLVLATGFDTHRFFRPMQITGTDGRTLDEVWSESNQGYLGVTVPGFPNWFMIGGPNSPIGNFSWLLTAENQFGYALQLIDLLRNGNARQIAPTIEATQRFNAALKASMGKTVWAQGCSSWYIDKNGNVASWPWTYGKFIEDMRTPNLDDFELA